SAIKLMMVQMPALNTPQFSWVKNRLPREPQPVPPIFQPEVAARAIYWAAHRDRAEVYVAWPTVKAIVGNKIAPRYADRYLAHYGFDAQQTDEQAAPDRQDNLWHPVPGDHGAHGRFDERARDYSAEFSISKNRGWFMLAAALGAVCGAFKLCRYKKVAASQDQTLHYPEESTDRKSVV